VTTGGSGTAEGEGAGAGGIAVSDSGGASSRIPGRPQQEVVFPTREQYVAVVGDFRASGFEMCADLCGVDYLSHPGRHLPDGVEPQRFEVVVNLLSLVQARRVRIRVQVPGTDAVVDSLFGLYPGVEAMEREAYDLFGIVFAGHPDMTRILMPEDWEGHPLRKDYGVGRVPVQFKGAPGPR
jgi:NADH-quinone oxidoreductase subunit C